MANTPETMPTTRERDSRDMGLAPERGPCWHDLDYLLSIIKKISSR
jgi:hypothetical protein